MYLISNLVSPVNPYSKSWCVNFGNNKPGDIKLSKLYLGSVDESGKEEYLLIASHFLKNKNDISKEELKKNRNRIRTSITSNKWDEAKLFPVIDLSFIKQYDILDTAIFEYDDLMIQCNILEVPSNIMQIYIDESEKPSSDTLPVLYFRKKTSKPQPFTRLYTNNSNRFDEYTTRGFSIIYKIDKIIDILFRRGWYFGADNITMNNFDKIFFNLKMINSKFY